MIINQPSLNKGFCIFYFNIWKLAKLKIRLCSVFLYFNNTLAQAACVRHACLRAPCVAWPLFSPLFSLSFFLSSPPSSAFDPLRGISRVRKFVSPNILAYLEDICKKKICFLGNFFFPLKKKVIFERFFTFYGQRSVTAAWATRSPWSIQPIFWHN